MSRNKQKPGAPGSRRAKRAAKPMTPFESIPLDQAPPVSEWRDGMGRHCSGVFRNNRYFVMRYEVNAWTPSSPERVNEGGSKMVTWLSIRRVDNKPVLNSGDIQHIKNELTDPEREGMIMLVAESQAVERAGRCDVWVLPKGGQWPWGFRSEELTNDETVEEEADRLTDCEP